MHSNNLAQRQPGLQRIAADGLELNKLRQSTFKGHRTLADKAGESIRTNASVLLAIMRLAYTRVQKYFAEALLQSSTA